MATIHHSTEAEWHALREENVGGSEVASLFYAWRLPDGRDRVFHAYEVPPDGSQIIECLGFSTAMRLWLEKSGQVPPVSLDGVERVDAGKFLEPALAAWARQKWGDWRLRKVNRYVTHDSVLGWGCSLDYEEHGPGMPPVEFKNIDGAMFRRSWVCDGEEILVPPMKYMLQLQAQIGAVGADYGWIVCCVGGNRLLRGRIDRHQPTQDRIAAAIDAFWRGVLRRVPPAHVADFESVAEAHRMGRPGAASSPPADLRTDSTLASLCRRHLRMQEHLAKANTCADSIKAQIGMLMGDEVKAMASGYRLSWPVINRKERTVPEKFYPATTYRGALTITPNDKD